MPVTFGPKCSVFLYAFPTDGSVAEVLFFMCLCKSVETYSGGPSGLKPLVISTVGLSLTYFWETIWSTTQNPARVMWESNSILWKLLRTRFFSRRQTGCQASQCMLLAGRSPQTFSASATMVPGNVILIDPSGGGKCRNGGRESSQTLGCTQVKLECPFFGGEMLSNQAKGGRGLFW